MSCESANYPEQDPKEQEMAELFTLEPDDRLDRLRDWIAFQWAFVHIFWPTEAQIVQIADWFKVLCETVMNECDAEFIRHCDKQE